MFLTIKFNRKTAVSIIVAIAAILIALILIFSQKDSTEVFSSGKVTELSDRCQFLSNLGWIVDESSETEQQILIPREFNEVYSEYNDLQLQQGFDLSKYAGQELTMYTYMVTNYETQDAVLATIYILKGTVVGGDIHSTTLNGFMHGIK